MSRDGTIAVGAVFTSDGSGGAVVYRDGKLERLADLAELPQGFRILDAAGVNDRGQILVHLVDDQGGLLTAILTPR